MSHPNVTDPAFDMKSSDAQIVSMLDKTGQPALIERAKAILRKILTKNARVYETDKAYKGLGAVAVYLAIEEYAPAIGKKLTQKECQIQSKLGPKLFKRTLDLCRCAKDLDESKISFESLVKTFSGSEALKYMPVIYGHFKKSCFDALIVDDTTWNSNHILVVCAVYCWCCDRVFTYPTYRGPDVAFHCGLSWENVQKSMFYNLNPHCNDKMDELIEEDRKANPSRIIPIALHMSSMTPPINASSTGNARGITPSSSGLRHSYGPTPANGPRGSYGSRAEKLAGSSQAASGTNSKDSSSNTPQPMEIDLTALSDSETSNEPKSRTAAGKKRAADVDEECEQAGQPPRKSRSGARKSARGIELMETEEQWMARPDEEIFFKNPGESRTQANMRIFYAWKRFMADTGERDPNFQADFGGGTIRDFVIT